MSSYDYNITYSGNQATLIVHTLRHGDVRLVFDYLQMPDGSKSYNYDCFNLAARQEMQALSDEEELAHDISTIMYLYEHLSGPNQDFLIDTFDTVISNHIRQFGRLIDTDLCSTIAYMGLCLNALAEKEPNGEPMTQEGKNRLLNVLFARTEEKFGDYFYLTRYSRTPMGLKPYLVSFNEFKKNL